MDWITLIPLFFQALIECIQSRNRADVAEGLINPGAREVWAIRRVLRRETGVKGRDLAAATREALCCLREMTPAEIEDAMCEAEETQ